MKTIKKLLALCVAIMLLVSIAACGSSGITGSSSTTAVAQGSADNSATTKAPKDSGSSNGKTKIVVWGLNPTVPGGDKFLVEEFNRTHPDIELVAETVPSSAGQSAYDNAKLMTAVSGGTPPDFSTLDRFLAGSWAIRGALEPLDTYIKGSKVEGSNFVDAAWQECILDGKTYAIPYSPGAMGFWSLAYNKDLFKKAGIVDEKGEAKPPVTWDELLADAKRLTITKDGKYDQIGFIPTGAASFFYQWSWAAGGEFIGDNGKKCTMNNPNSKKALEFLVKLADELGGAKNINDFSQGFQGDANDPFMKGKVGMEIIGEYFLPSFARYAPDLNFGMAFFPKPDASAPTVSWGGGWSMIIPKGSKHPDQAFKAIEWICGLDGVMAWQKGADQALAADGKATVPTIPALKAALPKFKEMYYAPLKSKTPAIAEAVDFFLAAPEKYDKVYWRPHNPASDILWQAQVDVAQEAIYHKKTVDEALKGQQDKVQKALDDAWSSAN